MCVAIPGRIVEVLDDEKHYALVEVSGVRRKVNVDLLRDEGVDPDDWVLIHVGFAMSKISEADAENQLRLMKLLDQGDAAMEEWERSQFGSGEVSSGPA